MSSSRNEQATVWKPRTALGQMVVENKISSMEQIYENGMRIQESEIVKHLLPDIKSQVVHVGIVQKQTDAGEMTRFSALVAVGNEARQCRCSPRQTPEGARCPVVPIPTKAATA